jgi:hypothetical protein
MARRIAMAVALVAGGCGPATPHARRPHLATTTTATPAITTASVPRATTTTVPPVATSIARAAAPSPPPPVPPAPVEAEGAATTEGMPGQDVALEDIARCESGGEPTRVSRSGRYRGKYQFDQRTWESVGGTGDPAAASEAEQDARAARLYVERGSQPWPTCG